MLPTLVQTTKLVLRRAFDLRPGEYFRAGVMQAYIFLIICTLLVIKPTVNSLFLSVHGARNLPIAFLLVALLAGLVVWLVNRVFAKVSLISIVRGTLFVSVLSLLVFGGLLHLYAGGWILYAVYTWVAIFAVLSASQFWLLANRVFSTREAKRIFGFIGAGAIAGGIVGGYFASLFVGWFGSINLLFLGAGLLVLGFPLLNLVQERFLDRKKNIEVRPKRPKKVSTQSAWQIVRNDKHLLYLAAVIGVSVLVAKLVDYQFSAIAAEQITDADRLTGFFGFWFSTFNVVSLLIQLFLTTRILKKIGLGGTLLLLPGGILIGALLLIAVPELWVAILLKMSDGCLKQSVNKSAVELLSLPIPSAQKGKAKTFIDVFVDSVATGLSGLLLLLVVRQLELPAAAVSALIALLVVVWLLLIKGVHGSYVASFRRQVKPKQSAAPRELTPELTRRLRNTELESPTGQVLNLLRRLRMVRTSDLINSVEKLLDHRSEYVRAEALRHLIEYDETPDRLNGRIQRMLFDKSTTVKIEALAFLIEHAPELRDGLLDEHLDDTDLHLRGAALIALAKLSQEAPELAEEHDLVGRVEENMAEISFQRDRARRQFLEIVVGHAIGFGRVTDYYGWLKNQLHHATKAVRRQAIEAAGRTGDVQFLPDLLPLLQQDDYRKKTARAVARYGHAALPYLDGILATGPGPDLLPGVVGTYARIPDPISLERLEALRERTDEQTRRHLLRGLGTLRRLAPDLPFHRYDYGPWLRGEFDYFKMLLVARAALRTARRENTPQRLLGRTREVSRLRKRILDQLFDERHASLRRIFVLLNLYYPKTDLMPLFRSLTDEKLSVRGSTIEILDNTLNAQHKRLFIPLFEAVALVRKPDAVLQFLELKPTGERQALTNLMSLEKLPFAKPAKKLLGLLGNEARVIELRERA